MTVRLELRKLVVDAVRISVGRNPSGKQRELHLHNAVIYKR
jgi:hypothetical protein